MVRRALLAASLITPFLAFCGYAFLNGFLATRGRELATGLPLLTTYFCPGCLGVRAPSDTEHLGKKL